MLQAIAVCSCICAFCLWCSFISVCCPQVVDRVTKLSASQFKCPKCPKVVQCTGIPNTRISEIRRMNAKYKNKRQAIIERNICNDTSMKKVQDAPEIRSDYTEKLISNCDPDKFKSSSCHYENVLNSY